MVLKKILLSLLFTFIFAVNLPAKYYKINKEESSIFFSGKHANRKLESYLPSYEAEIYFDEKNLDRSKFNIKIDLKESDFGDKIYNKTVAKREWFDLKNHRYAYFKTSEIKKTLSRRYSVKGILNIKGISKEISFSFKLLGNQDTEIKTAKAQFNINRLDFDIGTKTDPEAKLISKNFLVKLNIVTLE